MEGDLHQDAVVGVNDFPLLRRHEVQPGVHLSLLSGKFEEDAVARFERQEDTVEFNFILSGQAHVLVQRHSGVDRIDVCPDTFLTTYLPSVKGDFSIAAGQDVRMLGIELDLAWLESLLKQYDSELSRLLKKAPDTLLNSSVAIAPVQKMIARQMLTCPFLGPALALFLRGKTLELLAYQMDLFAMHVGRNSNAERCASLQPDEENKVRLARDILKERMVDPPGLEELARLCQLSVGKLKKGFRSVFGNTAFGCLHEDRMECAYQLLSERRMNVSEVAWKIGYTNVGHFGVAFRKVYGESPKKFQQQLVFSSDARIAG